LLLSILTFLVMFSLVVPFYYSEPIILGHYEGDIIEFRLDGCSFVLETADERFELVGYSGGEKENVIVYYSAITSGVSICMVGPMIRVLFAINV
ncbi:MAG: hypothetical protein ACC656_15275, partial [Candidatus Heimdallarchaeota archaeon]